jgi:hypothetical protein
MAISGRIGYRSSPDPELSSQSIDLGSLQVVDENSLLAASKTKFSARKMNLVCNSKGSINFTCVNAEIDQSALPFGPDMSDNLYYQT